MIESIISIEEPYHGQFSVTQEAFTDLEEAFDIKTKDIIVDSVFFDDQYTDHYTYLISNGTEQFSMQLRPFSHF
jgi:hypothetical protein